MVLSVGLPSGDPLGVSEGYGQPQHALRRARTCTKTKEIYRENSLYFYFPILSAVPHKRATWYEKLTTGPESAVGDVHVHVQVSRF